VEEGWLVEVFGKNIRSNPPLAPLGQKLYLGAGPPGRGRDAFG